MVHLPRGAVVRQGEPQTVEEAKAAIADALNGLREVAANPNRWGAPLAEWTERENVLDRAIAALVSATLVESNAAAREEGRREAAKIYKPSLDEAYANGRRYGLAEAAAEADSALSGEDSSDPNYEFLPASLIAKRIRGLATTRGRK